MFITKNILSKRTNSYQYLVSKLGTYIGFMGAKVFKLHFYS